MGQRLKTARKEAKLSLMALANILGVGDSTILRWENGTPIPASALPLISKATNHPIDFFLVDESELSKSKIQSATELGKLIDAKDEEIDRLKKRQIILDKLEDRFAHLDVSDDMHDVLEFLHSLDDKKARASIEKQIYAYASKLIKEDAEAVREEERKKKDEKSTA